MDIPVRSQQSILQRLSSARWSFLPQVAREPFIRNWTYRPPDWRPLVVRSEPSLDVGCTGEFLEPGEVFEVASIRECHWQEAFLELADTRGWVAREKAGLPVCFPSDEEDSEVVLCTYKLQLPCNCMLNAVKDMCLNGANAYHVGVVVYGREWSFYGSFEEVEGPETTGVRYLPPGAWSPSIVNRFPLGKTPLTEMEVNQVLQELEDAWLSIQYSVLERNCCHFSQALCEKLRVCPIPDHILRLDLYASKEVVSIIQDGKWMRRSKSRTYRTRDLCCGLGNYGRRAGGMSPQTFSCCCVLSQPYYCLRGFFVFIQRVKRASGPPQRCSTKGSPTSDAGPL